MKALKSLLAFALVMMLPGMLIAQSGAAETVGLFGKVMNYLDNKGLELIIGFVSGLGVVKTWLMFAKKYLPSAGDIFQEIGEVFIGGSNFFRQLDASIKADGKIDQDNLKEAIAAGKTVIAEAKDVIITITPKKNAPVN